MGDRYACPNDCSGHGKCQSMREMGFTSTATPLSNTSPHGSVTLYGARALPGSATWDAHSIFGCVCDSKWEVGLGVNQTQEAEYFGPDCSLLHCPSGDDPETVEDEMDCYNKTATGSKGVGLAGNLCHVDCSNRGICNYKTGECACFKGYHGQ
ncbi:unnamed protein product, partial [Choristocarpus tenellus]